MNKTLKSDVHENNLIDLELDSKFLEINLSVLESPVFTNSDDGFQDAEEDSQFLSQPTVMMHASYFIIPNKTFIFNNSHEKTSNRAGKLSGRVHSQFLLVDTSDCNYGDQSSINDEAKFSIFAFGGKRKKYMSRFRRIRVNYKKKNQEDKQIESEIVSSPIQTKSIHIEPEFYQTERNIISTKENSSLENISTNDNHIPQETSNTPYLEVLFDVKNINTYTEMRQVAGHIMWCNYINGEKTLIIHGGIQEKNSSIIENTYSDHIYTYSLTRQIIEEPKFFGTWEIPKGREGHTVHTNESLTEAWIFGGFDGEFCMNSIHYFSAKDMSFTYIHPKSDPLKYISNIPSPRYYHSSFFYNECIYIFGGLDSYGLCSTKFIYVFDTNKRKWIKPIPVPDNILPGGISEHAMCLFKKHYVVLHGGRCEGKKLQEHTYIIDLETFNWTILSNLQPDSIKNRSGHTVLNINDQLWIFGGNNALTNHNDISIMDIHIQDDSMNKLITKTEISKREIISQSFEDIFKNLLQSNPEMKLEHNIVGKLYVLSPCTQKRIYLHFASESGPVHFRGTLTKYSRLMFTHNSEGQLILKNQRSTEKKSTFFTMNTSSARSSRSLSRATPITLIPENQVDEYGMIKKNAQSNYDFGDKFCKYYLKHQDSETYLGFESNGGKITPKIMFGPDRFSLFYALPLKHRKVFIRSASLGLYLQVSRYKIHFSLVPDADCRLIWLYLELPNGKAHHYLRNLSGKFLCLENGSITLSHRSTPISIIHHNTTGRNSILISIKGKDSGYLLASSQNRKPCLTFCHKLQKDNLLDAQFHLSEFQ